MEISSNLYSDTIEPIDLWALEQQKPQENSVEGKREVSVLAPTKRRNSESFRKFQAENQAYPSHIKLTLHPEDKALISQIANHKKLAEVLLEYGKNLEGIPAIQKAILEKDYEAIQVLLQAGAILSEQTKALASQDKKILELMETTQPFSAPGKYHYSMTKKPYLFGTEYEIDSEDIDIGSIEKSLLSLRSHYYLSDAKGYQAQAIVRFFSLGALFTWAKDLDIYDDKGSIIGYIDGITLTTADARYNILDAKERVVAVAFLDDDKTGFSIVDATNYSNVIARLKREYTQDIADPWKVVVYQGHFVDPRVLKLFTAFAVDTASQFKKDR